MDDEDYMLELCDLCDGSGEHPCEEDEDCPECEGEGIFGGIY